jgi:hypothetical protein
MAELVEYELEKIKTNKNERILPEDSVVVRRIIESVRIIGMILNPILVDQFGNLISGLNRYLSYEKLGYKTIPTIVIDITDTLKREFIELSENVDRRHFTYLKYGQMLIEYKRIYELLNPESTKKKKVIGNLKKIKGTGLSVEEIPSFNKYFGDNNGKSERTVQNDVKVYKELMLIENDFILPVLHSLEDKLGMKHTKEELKNVINMDNEKLSKLISILNDFVKKNLKKSPKVSLKSVLIDLDSWGKKQQLTNEEMLTFGLYELYFDKPQYKEILDSIVIDLVKYEKFKKSTKSHKNLSTVKRLLKQIK